MRDLHYAHGAGDCPAELAEKGDALRIWVNEADFWMLRHAGLELVEVGNDGAVLSAIGATQPNREGE